MSKGFFDVSSEEQSRNRQALGLLYGKNLKPLKVEQFEGVLFQIIEEAQNLNANLDSKHMVVHYLYKIKRLLTEFESTTRPSDNAEAESNMTAFVISLKEYLENFIDSAEEGLWEGVQLLIDITRKEIIMKLDAVVKNMDLEVIGEFLAQVKIDEGLAVETSVGQQQPRTSLDLAWTKFAKSTRPAGSMSAQEIKQVEANLLPTNIKTSIAIGYAWALSMSEQFYYDNSLMLISKFSDDGPKLSKILRSNYEPKDVTKLMHSWYNICYIAGGTFGLVYKVTERYTQNEYAVKFIQQKTTDKFYDHCAQLLDYLRERKYLMKARESPFVVKFYFSIKARVVKGFFLVFEYCITDLRQFLAHLCGLKNLQIGKDLWYENQGALFDAYSNIKCIAGYDVAKVVSIYMFEVFCILDFLTQCNIIHRDIKPGNILISRTLHLKLADFGLVSSTDMVTSHSQIKLLKHDDLQNLESVNDNISVHGTAIFYDMEMLYLHLKCKSPMIAAVIKNKPFTYTNLDRTDPEPCFLSDLWAGGMVVSSLYLFGFEYNKPDDVPKEALTSIGIFNKDPIAYILATTLIIKSHERLFTNGLNIVSAGQNEDFTKFLATIFLPRTMRATSYVKTKLFQKGNKKTMMNCINIQKIESLSIFRKYNLNTNNVFLIPMPEPLYGRLEPNLNVSYLKFEDFIRRNARKDDTDFYDVQPGVDVMMTD